VSFDPKMVLEGAVGRACRRRLHVQVNAAVCFDFSLWALAGDGCC
jgi:hypothetical protein